FSTLDRLFAVSLDEVDRLLFALYQLHQGIRDVLFSGRVLLFDALDFVVSRIEDDGTELPGFSCERVAEFAVRRDLVLLCCLWGLVRIDKLDMNSPTLMSIKI